jgi:hypothetical protein
MSSRLDRRETQAAAEDIRMVVTEQAERLTTLLLRLIEVATALQEDVERLAQEQAELVLRVQRLERRA